MDALNAAQANARAQLLEKEVAFYRQLVLQNNHVLIDVHILLGGVGGEALQGQVIALRRRITRLMDAQASALDKPKASAAAAATDDDDNLVDPFSFDSPERRDTLAYTPGDLNTGATEGALSDVIDKAAAVAGAKCTAATEQIHGKWLEQTAKRVDRLLAKPTAAFESFHEAPTEDALNAFLSAYRATCTALREEFDAAHAALFDAQQRKKVEGLFATVVGDAVAEHVAPKVQLVGAAAAPWDAPKPQPQTPARAGVDASAARTRAAAGSTGQSVPPARAAVSQIQELPSAHATPRPRAESADRPQLAPASQARGGRVAAPQPKPLSLAALHPGTPASHHVSAARPATPGRHSAALQDSSQMHSLLGGGRPGTSASRPPTPGAGGEPTRLEQLRAVEHQLELQLGNIAGRKNESGSEAKYYALSRKIAMVRSELLRLQREEDAVSAVHHQVQSQRTERRGRLGR